MGPQICQARHGTKHHLANILCSALAAEAQYNDNAEEDAATNNNSDLSILGQSILITGPRIACMSRCLNGVCDHPTINEGHVAFRPRQIAVVR